ncbi:hypothetical protein E2562_011223 [Oryza meyeriana var. granulata]|uniref:Uncharacterized protein n=1 Tax=Oryza meyeriana var. granulata TaxID=110450 RepID=A0A6G1DIR4_9ORYZ|nr:hypothetical protein E2562_011223 [Oryza meyeriana var. granulata]
MLMRALIDGQRRAGRRRLKSSWPEVVGWPEFYAALKIINERPDVKVYMFRDGDDLPPPEHDPKRVAETPHCALDWDATARMC